MEALRGRDKVVTLGLSFMFGLVAQVLTSSIPERLNPLNVIEIICVIAIVMTVPGLAGRITRSEQRSDLGLIGVSFAGLLLGGALAQAIGEHGFAVRP